jgi:hypothetical protein
MENFMTTEEEKVQTTAPPEPDVQEPEGLDEDEPVELGDYPIDSLMIRTDKRSAFEVCRRIDNKVYILDPEFQRDFIWDEEKQCKLIESAIMRIPLPVFYLAETAEGKIVVGGGNGVKSRSLTLINNLLGVTGDI